MGKQLNTGRTHFQKGHTPAHKGKKLPSMIGNTNGFKKGNVGWNKGLKGTYSLKHEGQFKAGHTPWHKGKKTGIVPKTAYKKGDIPWSKGKQGIMKAWNKGIKSPKVRGELNPGWKGDDVGYVGLHTWVSRELGKPTKCESCERDGLKGRQIHWANKSQEYLRDTTDWIRLCAKCHKRFDEDYFMATGIRASRLRMSRLSLKSSQPPQ